MKKYSNIDRKTEKRNQINPAAISTTEMPPVSAPALATCEVPAAVVVVVVVRIRVPSYIFINTYYYHKIKLKLKNTR